VLPIPDPHPHRPVSLQQLEGCTVRLGRRYRERLFIAEYEDGSRQVVYPIQVGAGSVVFGVVGDL
jgi:hypothetical protein